MSSSCDVPKCFASRSQFLEWRRLASVVIELSTICADCTPEYASQMGARCDKSHRNEIVFGKRSLRLAALTLVSLAKTERKKRPASKKKTVLNKKVKGSDMNVRTLRHGPDASVLPDVLSFMPLVRCQANSELGKVADRRGRAQATQTSSARRLDGLRALRDSSPLAGAWCAATGPWAVRVADPGETPLSECEAAIAMRDFPNEEN